jgi:hypothetical protein
MHVRAGALGSLPGVIGWFLRHRKWLVIAYAVCLHLLVYYLALSNATCSRDATAAKLGAAKP